MFKSRSRASYPAVKSLQHSNSKTTLVRILYNLFPPHPSFIRLRGLESLQRSSFNISLLKQNSSVYLKPPPRPPGPLLIAHHPCYDHCTTRTKNQHLPVYHTAKSFHHLVNTVYYVFAKYSFDKNYVCYVRPRYLYGR